MHDAALKDGPSVEKCIILEDTTVLMVPANSYRTYFCSAQFVIESRSAYISHTIIAPVQLNRT